MEEKVDIVALGELLIDFTEAGHSQEIKIPIPIEILKSDTI